MVREKCPANVREKSGNFGFQSGKFRKTEKSQGISEYSQHIVLQSEKYNF